MSAPGHGNKAVIAALFANLGIAVAKFVGFLVTGSSSMLAESVHSVADTGNQGLLLLGGKRALKKATPAHPFGWGRERYFWSFVVALVLFSLGSVFAIYEGIHKLQHPEEITSPEWAIGILLFAILAETFSFRTAVLETNEVKGDDVTYRQFIRHSKSPELPVVLLEDLGALVGLTLALGAVITTVVTGDEAWDAYGTISIGVLLGIIAIVLAIEMKSLLIGESAAPKQQEAIRAAIEIEPGILGVIHMRTEHLGPDELLVCAKVEFMHDLSFPEVAEAVNRVENNIRANVAEARVIYLEPDVADEHRVGPMVPEHGGFTVTEVEQAEESEREDAERDRAEAEAEAAGPESFELSEPGASKESSE
jgi:cation diffusion facilitator family transporter